MMELKVRKATEADIPQLLPLMRELAEFEKYADALPLPKRFCGNRDSGDRHPTSIVWWRKRTEG
jgi:hypothetical protein